MDKKELHKQSFLTGIINQNPLFVSLLGLCPALAVTKSIEAAIGMGILFTIVLCCSNVLVSLLRKIIPEEARTPCEIVIIAAFVTCIKMLSNAFLPELYSTLGVFISLLVVNCIVLGRAEAFAKDHGVLDSLLDGLGNGIGYTLAIVIIAFFREVLGTGLITFGNIFTFIPQFSIPILKFKDFDMSMSFFQNPAGGFIVLAIILVVILTYKQFKAKKEKILEKKKQNQFKEEISK